MNSTNTVGKLYSPVGAMFMTVGGTAGTWKLGDIKPKDQTLNYRQEYVQEFDPLTGSAGKKYCYIDQNTATTSKPFKGWTDPQQAVGWWDKDTIDNFGKTDPGTAVKADGVTFKAGQGLYSNFMNAQAKLDFSGEVVCEEWKIDLKGKLYAPIINYLARTITLKEIVPENGCLNYRQEYVQEFDPLTGSAGKKYCYIDQDTATTSKPFKGWTNPQQAVGWWDKDTIDGFGKTDPGSAVKADDVQILPGSGFYSNFMNSNAELNFPSSIPTDK